VADRAALRRLFGQLDAVEQIPEPVAVGAAPGGAGVARAALAELADVEDAVLRQPALHLGADPGDLAQLEVVEAVRELIGGEHHQPVGLLQIGGELGEQPVGRDADRTGQAFADIRADARLDPLRQRHRASRAILVVEQPAGHFIDAADMGDGDVLPDLGDDRVVEFDIFLVPRRRDQDVAALALRFPDRRAGGDAVALGLDRCGDRDRGVGIDRRDDHRPAAKRRIELLLDAGEIAVEIEEQPAQRPRRESEDVGNAGLNFAFFPRIVNESCGGAVDCCAVRRGVQRRRGDGATHGRNNSRTRLCRKSA
jgi:hypothetical protein